MDFHHPGRWSQEKDFLRRSHPQTLWRQLVTRFWRCQWLTTVLFMTSLPLTMKFHQKLSLLDSILRSEELVVIILVFHVVKMCLQKFLLIYCSINHGFYWYSFMNGFSGEHWRNETCFSYCHQNNNCFGIHTNCIEVRLCDVVLLVIFVVLLVIFVILLVIFSLSKSSAKY